MKFEEALQQFINEIYAEYGIENGITKIGIKHDLMDRVAFDIYSTGFGSSKFTPSNFGEFILNGVQLLPREKDKF